jgi:hypothetical protein
LAVSLLIKIPIFLGFLVFLVIWTALTLAALVRFATSLRTRSTAGFLFTSLLPLDVVGLVGFFGMLGITALFFDVGILALMLLGLAMGYVLAYLAWEILGPLDRPFGSRLLWASARLTFHDGFQKFNKIAGAVALAGVVLTLGYLFFTEDIPSAEATQRIFKVVVVYLVVAFLITVLPSRLVQLLSPNLDEDVRTRLLLVQVGGLFTWTLFISLLVWSFEIGESGADLPMSGLDARFSVTVVVILLGVFLVTSLFPYLLGWRRARNWRQTLLQRERTAADRLISILKAPSETGYDESLERFQQEIDENYREFVERDVVVQRSLAWEDVPTADAVKLEEQLVFTAYRDSRETDPRLRYVDFLRRFQGELEAIREGLAKQTRRDSRRKKAESYVDYYEDQREQIEKLRAQESGRNWVWAGGSVVVLPVMGGVLGKIGERVWEIIDRAPPG